MSTSHVGSNQLALVRKELDVDEQDKGKYRSMLGMPNTSFLSCSVT